RGHEVAQPRARGRLDRDRAAGNDRRRNPVRGYGGRSPEPPFVRGVKGLMMNDVTLDAAPPPQSAPLAAVERSIRFATQALLAPQQPDGHWVFELEADATIPAEYVLLRHYRGEPVDAALEAKIAVYLRRIQRADGGWPLFHDGDFDMSASVKAYFALKM